MSSLYLLISPPVYCSVPANKEKRYRCLNADKLLVQQDPSVYFFISQGCLTVDNINDQEEMDMVEVCIDHGVLVVVCVCTRCAA